MTLRRQRPKTKVVFFLLLKKDKDYMFNKKEHLLTKLVCFNISFFQFHLLNTQQYDKSNGKSSCWYSAADVSNDGKS